MQLTHTQGSYFQINFKNKCFDNKITLCIIYYKHWETFDIPEPDSLTDPIIRHPSEILFLKMKLSKNN